MKIKNINTIPIELEEDDDVVVEKAKKHLLGIFTVVDEIKYESQKIVENILHQNLINDSSTKRMMAETLRCYLNQLIQKNEIMEFVVTEGGPIDNVIHIDLRVTPQLETSSIRIQYM